VGNNGAGTNSPEGDQEIKFASECVRIKNFLYLSEPRMQREENEYYFWKVQPIET
jgi:hypothetical protein